MGKEYPEQDQCLKRANLPWDKVEGFFMAEIECLPKSEVKRSYSAYLDFEGFRQLHLKQENPTYQNELENLIKDTHTNLETSLAERANAEIYRAKYALRNGQLFNNDIPFIDVIKHGQRVRENSGSNQVERELSEVSTFAKVQAELANGVLGDNAKIVVICPRKGIYQHNFYDIYSKNQDGEVQMRRFSSKSNYIEFEEAARKLDPFTELPIMPSDADFIAHPFTTYKALEDIHNLMNIDRETTSEEDLKRYIEACTPLILDYINYLAATPNPQWIIVRKKHNALLNGFDIISGRKKHISTKTRNDFVQSINDTSTFWAVSQNLSEQTVERVGTACGINEGYKISNNYGPQTVTDFANPLKEVEKVEDFQCPGTKKDGSRCSYIVRARSGVKKCPDCGMEATCA